MPTPQGWGRPGTRLRVSLHTRELPAGCWCRADPPAPGDDEQEGLWGEGRQAGAGGRAPRAVRALPPAV